MTGILCAGLICVDFVYTVDAFPQPGHKHRASDAATVPGGGALIAASAIAGLGGKAALAGTVGCDDLANFLRQRLVQRGIDDSLVVGNPGSDTSRSAILVTSDGERTIVNHRPDALFSAGATLPDPFPYAAVLVDTRWPAGAVDILRAARSAGVPRVVDAEAPVRIAEEALAVATHVVFSEQGLADYTGRSDAEALREVAGRFGVWAALTRGSLPVMCHDGRGLTEIPTFATKVVDTLGAGDVWHGAFALALGRGMAERDAVVQANAAAALHVSVPAGEFSVVTADAVANLMLSVRPGDPES